MPTSRLPAMRKEEAGPGAGQTKGRDERADCGQGRRGGSVGLQILGPVRL